MGLSLSHNMKYCIKSSLLGSFEGISTKCPVVSRPIQHLGENGKFGIRNDFVFNSNTDIELDGYLQSYKYFDPKIRDTLRFDAQTTTFTTNYLQPFKHTILVGIHVRRGDLVLLGPSYFIRSPPQSYFYNAMGHFRNTYDNVQFVITSDSIEWCLEQDLFKENDTHVVREKHTPSQDMAILAACDHIILSVGTFGWWAAYLGPDKRGGEILYYDSEFVLDHPTIRNNVILTDYYPKTWTSMSSKIEHWAQMTGTCMEYMKKTGVELKRFHSQHGQINKYYEHPEKFNLDAVILEIGAYTGRDIGVFFDQAKTRKIPVSKMSFYIYEPITVALKVLMSNYKNTKNVHIMQAGVGQSTGVLCVSGTGDAIATRLGKCQNGVPVIDVAEVLEPLTHVDLLHINCEGCEVPIIERVLGIDRQIKNKVDAIEVQFHPQHISVEEYCRVATKLYSDGFRLTYHFAWVWELWERTPFILYIMNIPKNQKCQHINNLHPLMCITTNPLTTQIYVDIEDKWNVLGKRMLMALPQVIKKSAVWYFKVDPDTTVWPKRLEKRLMMLETNINYVGQVYELDGVNYASGGAGYGIRRSSIQHIDFKQCHPLPSVTTNYEDVTVGKCLQKNGINIHQLDGLYGDTLMDSQTRSYPNHVHPVKVNIPVLTIHKRDKNRAIVKDPAHLTTIIYKTSTNHRRNNDNQSIKDNCAKLNPNIFWECQRQPPKQPCTDYAFIARIDDAYVSDNRVHGDVPGTIFTDTHWFKWQTYVRTIPDGNPTTWTPVPQIHKHECIASVLQAYPTSKGHFPHEVFPRLLFLLRSIPDDCLILVACDAFVMRYLELLSPSEQKRLIFWEGQNHVYYAKHVYVANEGPFCKVFNPHNGGMSTFFQPEVINLVRARFCSKIDVKPFIRQAVVIKRTGSRRYVQHDALVAALKHRKWDVHVFEAKGSLLDHVRLFASADLVVGPHGAGFSNLVFCRPNTTVIEIGWDGKPPNGMEMDNMYSRVAASLNLNYSLFIGKGTYEGPISLNVDTIISPIY
jgi:galactoside 2-L-fucosyltransferase 1/2